MSVVYRCYQGVRLFWLSDLDLTNSSIPLKTYFLKARTSINVDLLALSCQKNWYLKEEWTHIQERQLFQCFTSVLKIVYSKRKEFAPKGF